MSPLESIMGDYVGMMVIPLSFLEIKRLRCFKTIMIVSKIFKIYYKQEERKHIE